MAGRQAGPVPAPGRAQSRYAGSSVGEVDRKRRDNARGTRKRRWDLRRGLASVTSIDSVAGCGRGAVDAYVPVTVRDGVASFGQVVTCKSVWSCPVCSAAIRQRRAELVDSRGHRWHRAGRGLLFVTLTMPHTMADDLGSLLAALSGAWRRVQQNRAWRVTAEQVGIVGAMRATEITHGYNGWHPHSHVLLWTERPLTAVQTAALEVALYGWWADAVEAEGLGRPSSEHGVKALRCVTGLRALSLYVVKSQDGYDKARKGVGVEMMRGDVKRGRSKHCTAFEIAEKAVAGDQSARSLWRVYESATKGKRCQEWGRKLVVRLEADGMAAPPDELDPGRVVFEMSSHEWNVLRYSGGALAMLAAVEVHLERGGTQPGEVAGRVLHRAFDRYRRSCASRARGAPVAA